MYKFLFTICINFICIKAIFNEIKVISPPELASQFGKIVIKYFNNR